jgi:trehalose 6-phosphate phosphatase
MRQPARVPPPPPHGTPAPPLRPDCALFLDVDGTLAKVVDDPNLARIEHEVVDLLPRLARRLGGALALVTGRSIADVESLLPKWKLPIAGQHGCERRDAAGKLHLHEASAETLERMREVFAALAARNPELMFEDKGIALGVHYRRAPQLASHLYRTVRAALAQADAARQYVLQPGKMLIEVRPKGCDKGEAVTAFMSEPPFAGRRPVFVGDDRSDEHGFVAVEAMGGWSIKVGPGRTSARFRLRNVEAVARWLLAGPSKSDDEAMKSAARASTIAT